MILDGRVAQIPRPAPRPDRIAKPNSRKIAAATE
jgi:hypothetical protein